MAGRNVKAKGQGREKMLEELREKCRRRLKDERKNLVDTLRGLAQGKNVLDMHEEQLEAVRDFTRNLIERVKMDEGEYRAGQQDFMFCLTFHHTQA